MIKNVLQLNKKYAHLSRVDLPEVLADKSSYGQTFYVPPIARWNDEYVNDKNELVPALKNVKQNSGSALISQAWMSEDCRMSIFDAGGFGIDVPHVRRRPADPQKSVRK